MSRNNRKKSSRTTGFRVLSETFPSGMGCYFGQDLDDDYIEANTYTTIVGEYDTMEEAKQAAIQERNGNCQFDDWAEEYYDDDGDARGPPFCSLDGENPDEDDATTIYIVDIAKEVAKKAKENAEKENEIKKARNSKPPKKKAKKSGVRAFGPQKGNFQPDKNIFIRNPSRLDGAKPQAPSDFPARGPDKASFVYLIQRLSDRNYAMRGLCLDNTGARYTSFSLPSYIRRSIAWLPDTDLNDHASNETILDTFHTDLFNPENGDHYLTAKSLLAAASPQIECLFLTNFTDKSSKNSSKVIVQAIQACSPSLKCFSLNVSTMSLDILEALSKCPNLSGITFQGDESRGIPDHKLDAGLAQVMTCCPNLKWMYLDEFPFHGDSWRALAAGACPALEVLWIDCPTNVNDRIRYTVGDHHTIRRVLDERQLKICMINPDEKLKSSYVPAEGSKKATDRLKGKKAPKMPDFEEVYEEYCDY